MYMYYIKPALVLIYIPTSLGKVSSVIRPVPCMDGIYNLVENIRHNKCGKQNYKSNKLCMGPTNVHFIFQKELFHPFHHFSTICREERLTVTILGKRKGELREVR